MQQRILAAALFLTLLGAGMACRNLDLPGQGGTDGGNAPPDILFVNPHDGDRVGLNPLFSLDVEDVNGVREVRLSCNDQELKRWSAGADGGTPSFQGSVDLGSCRAGAPTVTGSDGVVLYRIAVRADAWDRLDAGSNATVALNLDTTVASVTLDVPPRVVPLTPLTILIRSDYDLQGPPQVTVGGAVPPEVPVALNGGRREYQLVTTAPGLGVDTWTGTPDADVPSEVLAEVERQLIVAVDARASSGVATHVEAPVLLSRVAWQANIPGLVEIKLPQHATPVATDAGVQVPISVGVNSVYDTGRAWLPGFFTAQDGTFVPFHYDAPDLQSYTAVAFDALGRTMMVSSKQELAFLDPGTNTLRHRDATSPLPGRGALALTRVGESLCQERLSAVCGAGSGSRTLFCMSVNGTQTTSVATDAGTDQANAASTLRAGSGNVYLGTNSGNCSGTYSSTNLFVSPAGGTGAVSTLAQQFVVSPPDILLLAPVGDGSFIIHTFDNRTLLISAQGSVLATYTPPAVFSSFEVAAAPDRSLLRMSNVPPHSVLELWGPGALNPSARGRLPSVVGLVHNSGSAQLPYQVVFKSTGEVAMLVQTANSGFGVATFDAKLNPRWLYHYPLPINAGSPMTLFPQLVGDESTGRLYFIDPDNGQVVALAW